MGFDTKATQSCWFYFRKRLNGGTVLEMYTLYIRSVVEQAAVVWHISITKGEKLDLEMAPRIILNDQYITLTHALKLLGIPTLRRKMLCLNFAKNCVKNSQTSDMFQKCCHLEHKTTRGISCTPCKDRMACQICYSLYDKAF